MGHVRAPAPLPVEPAPFILRRPAPRLAGHVRAYLGHDRSPTAPILRRIPALGSILVGIDLVRPVRRALAGEPAPAAVSPVSGLGDRPLVYAQTGGEKGIVVELPPRPGASPSPRWPTGSTGRVSTSPPGSGTSSGCRPRSSPGSPGCTTRSTG
ncbi:MAG TPA: hypothetical protein VFH84_37595 [Amycolatopsis sp.]|nr:hypothetical protein [Amycolatopsis sp.]HET6710741.1 hypothetical protein [Amycolatopsis sp.]